MRLVAYLLLYYHKYFSNIGTFGLPEMKQILRNILHIYFFLNNRTINQVFLTNHLLGFFKLYSINNNRFLKNC